MFARLVILSRIVVCWCSPVVCMVPLYFLVVVIVFVVVAFFIVVFIVVAFFYCCVY